MIARFFVDTNILLYAGSQDSADEDKRLKAVEILGLPGLALSAQVMQEYFNAAYVKGRLGISREEALRSLRLLAQLPVAPITAELVLAACDLADRYQISYWDAAILAASIELGCEELGCEIVYSEDLNHGQKYGATRVINPFID